MKSDPQKDSQKQPETEDSIDVANIVRQLEDLVKMSLECEEKELKPNVSFVEINKKLLAIRKEVERFRENYKQHLAIVSLTPEEVKPTAEELEALGVKEKQALVKLQSLQATCEDARERLHQSLQTEQEGLKILKEEVKDKSKEKIHRKGKFKGVGGKQGWLPS